LPALGNVIVALGANFRGPWGKPRKTLKRALKALDRDGVAVKAISEFYETEAIGQTRQPPYLNAVALVATSLPAPALLRRLKQIERDAGRRGGRPWGSRSLDLDIVDYKGLIVNWPGSRGRSRGPGIKRPGGHALRLPHPLMHERPFVLRPLLDLAPDWRHPVLKLSAARLWQRVARRKDGRVLGAL
jgi:2-amino-4-hydroxy-6-hydroxymethyldihydropteridine diphosphokinase